MTLWPLLVADPQVELGRLKDNPSFQEYVENLPRILQEILSQQLTIDRLMEAQYRAVDAFKSDHKALEITLQGLSQYRNAKLFLRTLNITITDYCQMTPGMTDDELAEMLAGTMTVRDLLYRRPAVILAPLLRQLNRTN